MQKIGLIRNSDPSIARRIVAILLITWVPLLAFSVFEGRALGPTPQESLLLDIATYARFFIAMPLLFIADIVVGPRLRAAGLHFVEGNFILPADLPAVERATARARRRCDASLPEFVILGLAFFGAWYLNPGAFYPGTSTASWTSAPWQGGTGLSLAGIWYYFVAVPILQFLTYRWLWRLLIWTLFLRELAGLKLNILATHPDRAGGLGFLGSAHVSLTIFAFASSSVLSGHWAFQIYFEAVPIERFQAAFAVYLIVVELICLGPLLIFVPQLVRARREGLRQYSLLAGTYTRAFEQKWVAGKMASPELLLGSADIQSLADLGNSFAMIREMGPFPFSRQHFLEIAVATFLPGLPLIFLVMPVWELLKLVVGMLV
jgi:hypothetical protein